MEWLRIDAWAAVNLNETGSHEQKIWWEKRHLVDTDHQWISFQEFSYQIKDKHFNSLPSDGDWRDTTVGLRRQSFEDPKVEMGLEKQLDDDEEEEEDCVDGLKVWNVRSKRQLSIFLALILSPLFPNVTSFSTSSLQNSQSKTCWLAGLDWLGWASRLGCLLFSLNWTNNWSYHSILHICRLPEVFAIFGAI